MAKPGPPRKPSRLRVLDGNAGRRSEARRLEAPSGAPPCPRWLSLEARREWRRVVRILSILGTVSKLDRAALAAYCEAWATWVEAQQRMQAEGRVVHTPNGYPVQSPWVSIANQAFKQMQSMISEFGLGPLSRSRIELPQTKDDGDEFLSFG